MARRYTRRVALVAALVIPVSFMAGCGSAVTEQNASTAASHATGSKAGHTSYPLTVESPIQGGLRLGVGFGRWAAFHGEAFVRKS